MKRYEYEFAGKPLSFEVGQLAQQANAAVKVQYGDTVVLATVVMSDEAREGMSYFPLMVDYEEKMYAAGKIKGSRFIKREGRPSEDAILNGRLIDRSIRPRFNKKTRNEVQVVATVLSADGENEPAAVALLGVSLALSISDIPWDGPLGVVRVAKLDGKFIFNPTHEQRDAAEFEMVVVGDGERINMIEGELKEASEKDIHLAFEESLKEIKKQMKIQAAIIKELGKEKKVIEVPVIDDSIKKIAQDFLEPQLADALQLKSKEERHEKLNDLFDSCIDSLVESFDEEKVDEQRGLIRDFYEDMIDHTVHRNVIDKGLRSDGRKCDEVRELEVEVGLLPRPHGSALFRRGQTQALSVTTLAGPSEEQIIDEMDFDGTKRYLHHYNFPAYSVGEARPNRGPGRRDIGHGSLAEKALINLIPDKEEFPYMIRVVSEILSSNGSSSMASVCGSTLSLLHAGVPLKNKAAGIAMGLMMDDEKKYEVLTDIQGPEDHHGDMDLKVAGTDKGVTAIQMDVKVSGISLEILNKAFLQAKQARLHILESMNKVIDAPGKMSPFAPKVVKVMIDPEKIKDVIGPGGKMIQSITKDTDTQIDIEQDGTVFIAGESQEGVDRAEQAVKDLTREIEVGEKFTGKVTRLMDFGAFVELVPNQEGLIHISKMASFRVEKVNDILDEGIEVTVEVIEIDDMGRINLRLISGGKTPDYAGSAPKRDSHRAPHDRKRTHNKRPNRRR